MLGVHLKLVLVEVTRQKTHCALLISDGEVCQDPQRFKLQIVHLFIHALEAKHLVNRLKDAGASDHRAYVGLRPHCKVFADAFDKCKLVGQRK